MKMQPVINYIKREWHFLLVLAAGIFMFFVYASFPVMSARDLFSCSGATKVANRILQGDSAGLCEYYGSPEQMFKFNSPDEMMNFFWTQQIAGQEKFYYEEPLENIGNNLLRPRSVNVANSRVMPGSFIGLPLIYGQLGLWLADLGLPLPDSLFYLTAFFAVSGIIFLYHLFKNIFNRDIALIASLLAYLFPGWVYYASRSFYHNALFVALLIIGVTLLVNGLLKAKNFNSRKFSARLGGLLLFSTAGWVTGLALITRSSEIGWVSLILLVIFALNWRIFLPNAKLALPISVRWHFWLGLTLFVIFLAAAFIPVIKTNYVLYGSPLSIGYETGLGGEFAGLIQQPGLLFKLLLSPFGIDLHSIAVNGYNYLLKFFWLYTIPVVFGLLGWLFSTSPRKPRQLGYLFVLFVTTLYLSIYYGSWQIVDRIDQQTVSLGTSYIRYFLPVYLGMLPFLAFLIARIIGWIRFRRWPKPIVAGLLIILLAYPGIRLVFWDTDESLLVMNENIHQQQSNALKLRRYVPQDALIVLGFKQADKVFFPEYKRIIPELAVAKDYEAVKSLSRHVAVYYYHFADPETAATISGREFEPFGLRIDTATGINVYNRDWLYRIVPLDSQPGSENN